MVYPKSLEEFFDTHKNWSAELGSLRTILLKTELKEDLKWGMPVYTLKDKNIVGIGAFKKYFGIWFYQGVFLRDVKKKLINAQEGKTRAMRQWRFDSIKDLDEKLILEYVNEAIQNHKDGKEIKSAKFKAVNSPFLNQFLVKDKKLKACYESLTPGRQKEYALYIIEAKREATKKQRVEKCIPLILAKKGLNDQYKK